MKEVVDSNDLTASWVTSALQSNGRLKSSVTDLKVERIGEGIGLMAELSRLRLTYGGKEDLPDTMIAKCAAQNENLAVAQVLDFYNREVNFYNRIGTDSTLRVPDSFYGAVDQETYQCVILMEDLGNVSPNDQIEGSSEDEAYAAVEKVAAMHARFWDKVDDNAWMYDFMSVAEAEKLKSLVYLPALEPAIEKFPDQFNEQTRKLVREVGNRYSEFWSDYLAAPNTFIHGDYRQDNFIYSGDSLDAIVMDWQISGKGKGIFDVTYFICQSLKPDMRRRIEQDLIKLYVDRLLEHGVKDYGFDKAYRDYRILVLGCLVYPITVCGTLDLANERGRALATCMLERNLTAIEELKSNDFI